MTSYDGEALPYPYRFVCNYMSTRNVRLAMQSDFPDWTNNFTGRSVFIYLRYTIQNYQNNQGNWWYANAYTHLTSRDNYYYVAQAKGRFDIVNYELPFLFVISLWTKSFIQRTCKIGEQCMFYGFLLPSTLKTSMTINRMSFELPREFNYTTTQKINRCTLQPTTTDL